MASCWRCRSRGPWRRASRPCNSHLQLAVPSPGNLRFGSEPGNPRPRQLVSGSFGLSQRGVYLRGPPPRGVGSPPAGHAQARSPVGLSPAMPFFTGLADYDVNLTLNRPAEVAHTGERWPGGRQYAAPARANVRDFAITTSDRYQYGHGPGGGHDDHRLLSYRRTRSAANSTWTRPAGA